MVSQPIPPTIRRLDSDGAVAFARRGDVLLLIGRAQVIDSTFVLFQRHMGVLTSERPGGVGVLYVVVHEQRPRPGAQSRLAAAVREFESDTQRFGLVIETRGFVAAVHRSIATAVVRLAGTHGKMNITGDLESTARWVVEPMSQNEQDTEAFVRDAATFRDAVVAGE